MRAFYDRTYSGIPISIIAIIVINFILLNIVTAIVIENVFGKSKKDEEIQKRMDEQKRITQWIAIKKVFL